MLTFAKHIDNEGGGIIGNAEIFSSCVIKPYRGVASDGVFLCDSKEQARDSFRKLKGANTYGGGINEKVLIQEFADGTEYAMDTVSMDGEVKVLALWRYTKVYRDVYVYMNSVIYIDILLVLCLSEPNRIVF